MMPLATVMLVTGRQLNKTGTTATDASTALSFFILFSSIKVGPIVRTQRMSNKGRDKFLVVQIFKRSSFFLQHDVDPTTAFLIMVGKEIGTCFVLVDLELNLSGFVTF